jgi:hypothetical protein
MPFVNPMRVVVELAAIAPKVVAVNGKDPPLLVGHVVLHVSPVRQIVVAERAVVEAYGRVLAVRVDVAVIYGNDNNEYIVEVPAVKFPTPATDRIEPGVEEPIPKFPLASITP